MSEINALFPSFFIRQLELCALEEVSSLTSAGVKAELSQLQSDRAMLAEELPLHEAKHPPPHPHPTPPKKNRRRLFFSLMCHQESETGSLV